MGLTIINYLFREAEQEKKITKPIKSLAKNELNETALLKIPPRPHKKLITSIQLLKDGRIASSGLDGILNIYKKGTFKIEIKITVQSGIHSFSQLFDGRIVICTDSTMNIIKLLDNNKYEIEDKITANKYGDTIKVFGIKKDEFISIHQPLFNKLKSLILWKLNRKNKYECISTIKDTRIYNFLKINKKEFVTSQQEEIMSTSRYVHNEYLKFYNINNFKCIETLYNISIVRTHTHIDRNIFFENMIMLNKNILCVAGDYYIYIIDISKHKKIKTIYNKDFDGEYLNIFKFKNYLITNIKTIQDSKKDKKIKQKKILIYKYDNNFTDNDNIKIELYKIQDIEYNFTFCFQFNNNILITNDINSINSFDGIKFNFINLNEFSIN